METASDATNRLGPVAPVEEYLQCPTCECKLQHFEVKTHLEQEMERLRQMQIKAVNEANAELSKQSASNAAASSEEQRKPWTIFQRVQRNRHTRFRRRTGKRPPSSAPATRQCPVCNRTFPLYDIQQHAEHCLRRSNGTTNGPDAGGSSSNEDDDAGEEYEEYEWAGQKRIRVSSLLQGGYAAIGIGQSATNHVGNGSQNNSYLIGNEEEEDLNVDEDDTHIYGPAQYGEADVIPPASDQGVSSTDNDVTNYMRRLITGTEAATNSIGNNAVELSPATNTKASTQTCVTHTASMFNGSAGELRPSNKNIILDCKQQKSLPQIIESLKSKIRHYENHSQNKIKCLICLDDYKNPAISVACWHVHCEECWLRSLGARKLCPQCNLITTPKDLRRIFM
ncbi:E3 ubiquitin-protein ligase Rnf220 [Eurosta solidaginis]|uniref:E3 ubiquitin-protein ligase Rnf220 n=1 Tax=Eurosta solidaginis TaxID=178769 RepID=UPI003530FACA